MMRIHFGCSMNFGIYLPDNLSAPAPALFWLSGLTCTENNFITKAGAQRVASELGMILVAPDTSPRGEGVPDDPDGAYDFGLGAGFYVNAIQSSLAAALPNARLCRAGVAPTGSGIVPGRPAKDSVSSGIQWAAMGHSPWHFVPRISSGQFLRFHRFAPL